MATPNKKKSTKSTKKRKGRVKLTQRVRLIEKNDATKVARIPLAPTRLAGDNGANFKIRIRRK